MTTSRFLCPLDCGWHHDQPDPMPDLALAKLPLPTPDLAYVLTLGHLHGVEAILRTHLETHELVEWVQALQTAKQHVADEKARQEAYEESVVGALNERNTRDCQRAEHAEAQVARVRNFLEDMAGWCSPHGVAADYARRGLDALDGVDPLGLAGPTREQLTEDAPRRYMAGDFLRSPKTGETPTLSSEFDADIDLPELTGEDAIEAMQDMATDLYRAEDRLAFVREMCDLADREQRQVTTEQVRAWSNYTGCANSTPDGASLAQSLGVAMAAMQPGAELVFCHHENAVRSSHTTMQAGWCRKTVHTVSCPTCEARAESTEGEPVLAPYVLNAERCTGACTERHTYRPGCLMQPVLLPPGSPDGRHGYAGESERLPDGSCPAWCPCHRLRAEEQR